MKINRHYLTVFIYYTLIVEYFIITGLLLNLFRF